MRFQERIEGALQGALSLATGRAQEAGDGHDGGYGHDAHAGNGSGNGHADGTREGASDTGAPPRLAGAMRHAVLGGGKRLRPTLLLAVADAVGDDAPELADAAAAAVELLHAASLVHDDLPSFDDAELRRGVPTVHRLFGEPVAVLAGDALIVLAFQVLSEAASRHPARLPRLVSLLAEGAGAPRGIVAGQAWESEDTLDLATYHRQKTGALFEAAVRMGAVAGGGRPEPWAGLGMRLGEAYQVADDLQDLLSDPARSGKPNRDVALGRPNAAVSHGIAGALARLHDLTEAAAAAVPPCPGQAELRQLVRGMLTGWLPGILESTLPVPYAGASGFELEVTQ